MCFPRSQFGIAFAAAVAAGFATPPVSALSASRVQLTPANLCAFSIQKQLKALGVGTKCKQAKTAKIGAVTIEGANWGSTDDSIGVQVYMGVPASRFKQQFGSLGSPVSLGSFAREDTGASGVAVGAWVNGVGLVVNLNHPGAPAKNEAYRAPILTLAKAIAKQI